MRHNLSLLVRQGLVEYQGERRGRVYRRAALAEAGAAQSAPAIAAGAEAESPERAFAPAPTINALFYSPPNAMPYASIYVEAEPADGTLLDDDVMDAFDRWVETVRSDATAWQSVPQVVRWHVPGGETGGDLWQASLQPGVHMDVHWAMPVRPLEDGTAVPMIEVWRFWKDSVRTLPQLLVALAVDQFRLRLSLQTYPSGQPGVIDIDFTPLAPPRRGAPPSGTPPWSYVSPTQGLEVNLDDVLKQAADSLIRHFSYRRVESVVAALQRSQP